MEHLSYSVGMGQMLVQGGNAKANMERACNMVRRAAESGCRIVVLPECMDIGWTCPTARAMAEPVPGPRTEMLAGQAREHGIFVVAGLTERHGERIYNAAVLISPQGVILAKHRKINVLDIAQDLYSIGDSLSVTETELGTIALTICADNFPDSLAFAHSLARMGAQIILSPSAWAMPANHDNSRDPYGALWMGSYTTIARLYDLPVVGVSNVGWIAGGPWSGQKCIGCSLAIGNTGDVAALGSYGEAAEELVCAQISVTPRTVQGTAISGMVASKGYQEARWVTS